ncbi:MAG: peptidoglycan-binding protein, partial [Vicinamibacterales bacterium]
MNLQGRNLELNLRGDDVALLQTELRQLDFQIADPPGLFGSTTLLSVRRFQAEHDVPVTGIVDARTAALINQAIEVQPRETWLVQGRLLRADGTPPPRSRVRAFEKQLRRDIPLGEAVPDAAGIYRIAYVIPQERDLSLIVRAFDASGNEIAASSVICLARSMEMVDLVVGNEPLRGPSLFARLQSAIRPTLEADRVVEADLTEDDVQWLACRHDLDAVHLTRLVAAARLARDAQLPGEHEALFGLMMQHLPTVLEALIAQAPETFRRALERAIADNDIGALVTPRIAEIIDALQAVIVRIALRQPTPEEPSFASLFEFAGTPQRHRNAVLTEYVRRTGTVAEFWEQQRRRLGDEAADELEFVVRIAALSMNHEPLVRQLTRMRAGGEIDRDLASLARFSREDWLRLLEREVDGRAIGAPAFLARTDADRTALFATFLVRYVEAGAPTRVLTERLASDAHPTLAPAVAFLRRHPAFDFRSNRIGEFLRENPNALDDDTSPDETRASLRAMQRLFDVAPPFDKHRTVALFSEGIASATQIRRLGESAFVERAAASLGGTDAARTVYANAAHKADTALLLLSQSASMNPTATKVLAPQLFGEGIPDLEDLFGTLDSCRCRHCASVYGPAAYLVDILHFLSNTHSATPGESALDVLFERRPDIGEVDLDCANAETTLPYVDLVMEILENAIAAGGGFPFQTEGEAADLLASPARLNQAAYDELELGVYPWSLPFELSIETARTYLEHLGVPRHALMQRFRGEADPSKALDVATEYLGLGAALRAILIDPEAAPAHSLWGFANAGAFNQMVDVANAATVLERSRLSYEELDAALAVRFVDAVGDIDIEFAGAGCDLHTATLTNLTSTAIAQLQAFMRVQRKLGWSIEELDAILETLDVTAFDEAALLRLADAKRLQESLNVPVRVLLAWWQSLLATRGIGSQASLYTELFLDASVNRPEMAIFALNASGTELLGADTELVSANLAPIHASLGITAADLDALLPGLPDAALNRANLTRLARPALLAKALRLKLADYLALRALSGIEPIGHPADTAATLRFADVAAWLKQAGYGLPVLDYLLRHRFAANAAFVPAETGIGSFLATLRIALRAINAEFALAPPDVDQGDPGFVADPDGSRTVKYLAMLLPADAVDQTMALIRQDTIHAPADPEGFIETSLGAFLDPAEAAERLLGEGSLTTFAARDNYVLGALLAHVGASARRAQVATAFAEALQVDAPVAAALLGELVHSTADASRPIQDDFTDAGFVGPPDEPAPPVAVDRATFPLQFTGYERTAKLVQFARLLGLGDSHLRFVLQRGPGLGWVDLTNLPLSVVDDAEAGFSAFQRMANALAAGTRLPGGLADFFGLLETLDAPDMDLAHYLEEVSLRTGWNR